MRPTASLIPTTAWPVGSATTSMPASAMRAPPMPTTRGPGANSRRARQSVAPWRSPDAAPAESMITGVSALDIHAHHRDACGVGHPHHLVAIHEQELAAVHRQGRRAAGGHGFERCGPDGGNVEAVIVR